MNVVTNKKAATPPVFLLFEGAAPVGSDSAVASSPFVSDRPHISSNGHSIENCGLGGKFEI